MARLIKFLGQMTTRNVVVLVEFFVSKTHATFLSLFLYFYYLFNIFIFSLFLFFSITISNYLSIKYVYLPRPTYLGLPT